MSKKVESGTSDEVEKVPYFHWSKYTPEMFRTPVDDFDAYMRMGTRIIAAPSFSHVFYNGTKPHLYSTAIAEEIKRKHKETQLKCDAIRAEMMGEKKKTNTEESYPKNNLIAMNQSKAGSKQRLENSVDVETSDEKKQFQCGEHEIIATNSLPSEFVDLGDWDGLEVEIVDS